MRRNKETTVSAFFSSAPLAASFGKTEALDGYYSLDGFPVCRDADFLWN